MHFRKNKCAGPPAHAAQSRAGIDHRYLPPTDISRARVVGRIARAPCRVLVIRIALPDPTRRGNVMVEFWRQVRVLTGAERQALAVIVGVTAEHPVALLDA